MTEAVHTAEHEKTATGPKRPVVRIGKPFPCAVPGKPMDEVPVPDAGEIGRVQRVLASMMPLFGADDSSIMKTGLVRIDASFRQWCVYAEHATRDYSEQVPATVEQACCKFIAEIAGQDTGELFKHDLPEELQRVVSDAAADYIESDGGTIFSAETVLCIGDAAVSFPAKAAPKPKQTPQRELITIHAFVDRVAFSSREVAIRDRQKKLLPVKYDVEKFLPDLCEGLRDRDYCYFKIEKITDDTGKVTQSLLDFEELQADLFRGLSEASPEKGGAIDPEESGVAELVE